MTFEQIKQAVCAHYGISMDDINGRSRRKRTVRARQMAMLLCHEETGASLFSIGAAFDRDHTTVMHARDVMGKKLTFPDRGYDYASDKVQISLRLWQVRKANEALSAALN